MALYGLFHDSKSKVNFIDSLTPVKGAEKEFAKMMVGFCVFFSGMALAVLVEREIDLVIFIFITIPLMLFGVHLMKDYLRILFSVR